MRLRGADHTVSCKCCTLDKEAIPLVRTVTRCSDLKIQKIAYCRCVC